MLIRFIFIQIVALCLSSCLQADIRKIPEQYATIQSAINAAGKYDTIEISAGTYTEAVKVTNKSLTIKAKSGDKVTVKVTLQPDPNVQAKFWRVRVR